MRSISRILNHLRPNDGIAPSATPAPPRTPSWPGSSKAGDDYTPLNLPPENPHLLRAFPYPAPPAWSDDTRPPCRILAASHTEQERQRRTAALAFERAVAENTLILRPDDATAAGYLAVLTAAQPVIDPAPAVTR